MMGYTQMTIFDFLQLDQREYPDINTISEAEAVRIVGDALGVEFVWSEFFQTWQAVKRKVEMTLNYAHYDLIDNHDLFLSAGYDCKAKHCGGGAPCSGIREAIAYLERKVEEVKNDRT